MVDWLEVVGLGQYRRRFVHHAVSGALLLRLSSDELKVGAGWAGRAAWRGGWMGRLSAGWLDTWLVSRSAASVKEECRRGAGRPLHTGRPLPCPLPPFSLQSELGIGPLGHREALLTAVNDLEEHWQQLQQQGGYSGRDGEGEGGWEIGAGFPGSGSAGGSTGSPTRAGYGLQRAYAQRVRLLRDLEKAEGREAQRRQ